MVWLLIWMHIYKMVAIFWFSEGQGYEIFLYDTDLWNGSHFFNIFIMADADILFPLTLRKPETQTSGGQ